MSPDFDSRAAAAAFPRELSAAAQHCVGRLGPIESLGTVITPPRRPIVTWPDTCTIPYRLYFAPRPVAGARTADELVWACLHTRHHDGHVRQQALSALLERADSLPWWWVTPWVAQLAAEYVAPIVEQVAQFATHRLPDLPHVRTALRDFGSANPDFVSLCHARAASCWAEYHRSRWPDLNVYPGRVALHHLFD